MSNEKNINFAERVRAKGCFDTPVEMEIAAQRWELALMAARRAERPIPILERIHGSQTALVIVDMQSAFLDRGAAIEVPRGRDIVPNINKLAHALRDIDGRVVFFKYCVNGKDDGLLVHFESKSYLGNDRESPLVALMSTHQQNQLYSELDIDKRDKIIKKNRYSAVMGSNIVRVLREWNISNVIISGVTTDVCAGNTAECLMQADFHVVIAWDGTAALDELRHELWLSRFFLLYGDVMTTEQIIERLE